VILLRVQHYAAGALANTLLLCELVMANGLSLQIRQGCAELPYSFLEFMSRLPRGVDPLHYLRYCMLHICRAPSLLVWLSTRFRRDLFQLASPGRLK